MKYFKKEYENYNTPESLKEVESALVSFASLGNFIGTDFGSSAKAATELFNMGVTNVSAKKAANQGADTPAPFTSEVDIKAYETVKQQMNNHQKEIDYLKGLGISLSLDEHPQASKLPLKYHPARRSPFGGNISDEELNNLSTNSIYYQYIPSFSWKDKDGDSVVTPEKLDKVFANIRPFMTEIAKQNMIALKEKGFNIGFDKTTKQMGILQKNGEMLLPLKELIQLPLKQLLKNLRSNANLYSNPEILRILEQKNNDAAVLKKKNSQSPSAPNKPDNIDQNKRGLLSPVLMPKKTSSLPTEEIIRNSINKSSLPYASSYNVNTNSKLINQILNMPRSISQKLDLSFTFNPTQGGTIKHSIDNNIPVSSKNSGTASVVHKDYSQMVMAKH